MSRGKRAEVIEESQLVVDADHGPASRGEPHAVAPTAAAEVDCAPDAADSLELRHDQWQVRRREPEPARVTPERHRAECLRGRPQFRRRRELVDDRPYGCTFVVQKGTRTRELRRCSEQPQAHAARRRQLRSPLCQRAQRER